MAVQASLRAAPAETASTPGGNASALGGRQDRGGSSREFTARQTYEQRRAAPATTAEIEQASSAVSSADPLPVRRATCAYRLGQDSIFDIVDPQQSPGSSVPVVWLHGSRRDAEQYAPFSRSMRRVKRTSAHERPPCDRSRASRARIRSRQSRIADRRADLVLARTRPHSLALPASCSGSNSDSANVLTDISWNCSAWLMRTASQVTNGQPVC